ncbi:hypothetical protein [Blastomonas sp.]|uniref:hypothetical protein n=1 Tax=Blastomonas sp. TaxID=1909299 RepID=UPI00391DEEE6
MRNALLVPLAFLAACSNDKPADDALVTLDGDNAAQQGTVSASAGGATPAPVTGVQAVDAEGSKLEPLLSSAISEAGLVSGSCRFSPSEGALPVLVASRAGGKGIISVAGRQIDVAPAATVAATGGSFSGDGVTLTVSASDTRTLGSAATMQVNDADGPAFTYSQGFWVCN